jgi:hypothetical protein
MAVRSLSIGFKGGQVIAARVEQKQAEALYQMLGTSGWYVLDAEEGSMRFDLGEVAFVRSDDGEHKVGFRA